MSENLKESLRKKISSEFTECRGEVFQYLNLVEIPNYFYHCMFGELVKIFGSALFFPNEYTSSYREQIDTELTCEGGTAGWYSAFAMTCKITDMEDLLEVYNSLNWMNSDHFDEYICDHIMTEIFDNVEEYHGSSPYSTYLRQKGRI